MECKFFGLWCIFFIVILQPFFAYKHGQKTQNFEDLNIMKGGWIINNKSMFSSKKKHVSYGKKTIPNDNLILSLTYKYQGPFKLVNVSSTFEFIVVTMPHDNT